MIAKNDIVLSRYIAGQLNCLISIYENSTEPISIISSVYGLSDPVIGQADLLDRLLLRNADELPHLLLVNDCLIYASVFSGDLTYVIGPLRTDSPLTLKERVNGYEIASEWLSGTFSCSYNSIIDAVLLLHNLFHDVPLDRLLADKLFAGDSMRPSFRKKTLEVSFQRRETQVMHNPYSEEERLMKCIERGDAEGLEKCWEEDISSGKNQQNFGHLAKNLTRNTKNLGISVIVLASRAAIRGGAPYEAAFTLVDSYIQQLEDISGRNQIPLIIHEAEREFTEMTALAKQQGQKYAGANPYVDKCKDYIQMHLHDKICISEIAEALHVNENYLSHVFKKGTGMTICAYVQAEKIRLTKDLLLYSPYSYIEIANLLAFSSQSYLGTVFKKETGMTLREFRIQSQKKTAEK